MAAFTPVGIDLGTTYSAIARVDADGRTAMIQNGAGDLFTPSVVKFEHDRLVIGEDALLAAPDDVGQVAENAKRDIGRRFYRQRIAGRLFPPEVIEGCLLRELRKSIVSVVGEEFGAVITVPAYFDEARRKSTADAGTMSGIEVLDIVNEPTAAALAFGERLGYLGASGSPRDSLKLLVYDLGGGTFDVTVIQLSPGAVRTLATDGDVELGGLNWDARLAEHAESRFLSLYPGLELEASDRLRLSRAAQNTKHQLSQSPLAVLKFEAGGQRMELPITRDEFEELTADLLERTCFTTRQALSAAGLLWTDIDRLLLVGGSTRMPMVRSTLEALSQLRPDDTVHPEEAVARGAAIYAHSVMQSRGLASITSCIEVTNVNAHSLGLEGIVKDTLRKENITLIPRNTPLPCKVHRSFVTRKENQQSVDLQLLEGESSLPSHCSQLGRVAIRNLPRGLPEGTEIDVCYSFEANGRLTVRASIPRVGNEAHIELERTSGLTDASVSRWRTVICRDGGYSNFEEALADLMLGGFFDETSTPTRKPSMDDVTALPEATRKVVETSLDPAVPFGAPLAASEHLREEISVRGTLPLRLSAVTRRQARLPLWARVLGFVSFSVGGLIIGYYLACWLDPEANFLDISLPGLPGAELSE